MAIQVDDFNANAVPAHFVTNAGHGLGAMQDEAGNGVIAAPLVGHAAQPERVFEVVDVHHAVDQPGAILALHGLLAVVFPVLGQVAGDDLHHVGHGDDADHAAVFVDHHGHVHARILEQIQQTDDRRAVEHHHGFDHAA